jgi:HEAT repeat protein
VPPAGAAEPSFADRTLTEWTADLGAKDPLVREEAIEVLIKIGAAARTSVPRLAELYDADPSPAVRRRAAVALWRLDGRAKPARDLLTAELKAPVPTARLKAVALLREMGVVGRELTPTVLESVQDPDGVVNSYAASLLNQMGEDAVPAVVAALPKASPAKRQTLVSFLQLLGPKSAPAVAALRELLKDRDAHLRLAAVRALWPGGATGNDVLGELQNLLKSRDAAVKAEATVAALVLPRKPKALEPFYRTTLKEGDPINRVRAAEALWELDPKSLKDGLPVLIQLLKDQTGAGYFAVQALHRIGPDAKDAIPELIDLSKVRDYRIAPQTVVQTLGRMGPDAVDPLLDLLRNPAAPGRPFVTAALTAIGTDGLPKIAPVLTDKELYVRRAAYQAIIAFGPAAKRALPQLIEGLRDPDLSVRQSAIRLIGQIGPDAEKAVPNLMGIVKDTTQLETTRAMAAEAVAHIGQAAKSAVEDLTKLLKHPSPALRFRVAEALCHAGGNRADAVPAMLDILLLGKPVASVSVQQALAALLAADVAPADVARALGASLKASSETAFRQQVALGLQQWPAAKPLLPVLNELAADKDLTVRYYAAVALARFGADGKNAVAALGQVLAERPNLWRETAACSALATLGPAASDLFPRLMDQFRAEVDPSHKIPLAEAAIAIDREKAASALAWLRDQIKSGTTAQRTAVAPTLARMDATNRDVLNWLLVQADDPNPAVAADGLQSLGLLREHGKPAADFLRKSMAGTDALLRVRAALSLWQIESKPDETVPVLVAALSDKSTASVMPGPTGRVVAAQAATALGEMGAAATPALPALRDAKRNGDLMLSAAAAAAIRKIEAAK